MHPPMPLDGADDPGAPPTNAKAPQKPALKRERGRFASAHPTPGSSHIPPPAPPQPNGDSPSADRIEGAAAIALFLYNSSDEKAQKKLYHAVGPKRRNRDGPRPPVGKDGGQLVASRAKLRAYWDWLNSNKTND